tara:strand:+ start:1295 stop:2029 length:735 start_codon:yes stop_codon:yes gene_type:complete
MLGLGNSLHSETSQLKVSFSNNYSLSFDGTNDFIAVDSVGESINKDAGTLAFWMDLAGSITASGFIFRAQSGSLSSTDNIIQMMYHASDNELRFSYKGQGGGRRDAKIENGHTSLEGQGWKHIVATWDTSANELKIYLNGSLIDTHSSPALDAHDADLDNVDIGRNTGSGAAPFKGNLDEVAVFNTVVSASDLYNSGVVKDLSGESGLIAYWRFEEGSGSSATDSSSNSHTGTISGATHSTDLP